MKTRHYFLCTLILTTTSLGAMNQDDASQDDLFDWLSTPDNVTEQEVLDWREKNDLVSAYDPIRLIDQVEKSCWSPQALLNAIKNLRTLRKDDKEGKVVARLVARGLKEVGKSLCTIIDGQGSTVLHLAASEGLIDMVKIILSAAKQQVINLIFLCNRHGKTASHLALQYGHFNNADLIRETADKHTRAQRKELNQSGWTSLHIAARDGNLEQIQQVLNDAGDHAWRLVSVQEEERGWTPLHVAAFYNQAHIIEPLLETFFNDALELVHMKDNLGNSAIILSNEEIVRIIINYLNHHQ